MNFRTLLTLFLAYFSILFCVFEIHADEVSALDSKEPIVDDVVVKSEDSQSAKNNGQNEADIARRRITSRVFRLNNINAEEVAERLNAMWSADFGVSWKITKIAQAFTESNSVVVTAPSMILDACADIIRSIDVEVPQVYIEARFIELSNNINEYLN